MVTSVCGGKADIRVGWGHMQAIRCKVGWIVHHGEYSQYFEITVNEK